MISLPKMLPKNRTFDTVRTDGVVSRRGLLTRLLCMHREATLYTHTDHRSGPGWMADNYAGSVCKNCGTILNEVKTY